MKWDRFLFFFLLPLFMAPWPLVCWINAAWQSQTFFSPFPFSNSPPDLRYLKWSGEETMYIHPCSGAVAEQHVCILLFPKCCRHGSFVRRFIQQNRKIIQENLLQELLTCCQRIWQHGPTSKTLKNSSVRKEWKSYSSPVGMLEDGEVVPPTLWSRGKYLNSYRPWNFLWIVMLPTGAFLPLTLMFLVNPWCLFVVTRSSTF